MAERVCKQCLLYEIGDQESKNILEYQKKIPNGVRIDGAGYEKRMGICKSCDDLISATCGDCGCYVELRGFVRDSHCPKNKW